MISDQIKSRFIAEILTDEGKRTISDHKRIITKFNLNRPDTSGNLLSHLNNQVQSNNTTASGTLRFTHIIYQRFLDMKFRGRKRKRKYPIHMRIAMGHFSSISYKLMHYMTEDVVQRIKQQFQEMNTKSPTG